MGRPEFSANRTAKKAGNPFTAWISERKERRRQAREAASRMITNKIAENENILVDQLSAIDFLHSKLPRNILEAKSKPTQSCGDLEYAQKSIIREILNHPQTIKVDIRKIDEKILELVMLFKQSVEQGDVRAAYAAKGGIVKAIKDIRSRIPHEQPELTTQFVELNAEYLSQWVTLVEIAQVADRTKQNIQQQRAQHDRLDEKIEKEIQGLADRIEKDPEFLEAYHQITMMDTPEERTKWTEIQREVHNMMVESRLKRANQSLSTLMLQQQESILAMKEAEIQNLFIAVSRTPVYYDKNLMNKYKEAIDALFDELAKSDAEIDETLKEMDDIEGRIAQMDSAPGTIRAREIATEQAEVLLEELKKRQEQQTGQARIKADEKMRELGLRTKEEQEQLIKEFESKQQEVLEEMMESEGQILYN